MHLRKPKTDFRLSTARSIRRWERQKVNERGFWRTSRFRPWFYETEYDRITARKKHHGPCSQVLHLGQASKKRHSSFFRGWLAHKRDQKEIQQSSAHSVVLLSEASRSQPQVHFSHRSAGSGYAQSWKEARLPTVLHWERFWARVSAT